MQHNGIFQWATEALDLLAAIAIIAGLGISLGGVLTEIYLRGYYRCRRLVETKGATAKPEVPVNV